MIVKECESIIGVLKLLAGPESEFDTLDLTRSLQQIFELGTSVSSELRAQQAAFEVSFPRPFYVYSPPGIQASVFVPFTDRTNKAYLRFDPVSMQTEFDRPEKEFVGLVVRPAIYKLGNGQGENYNKSPGCFQPALLVCIDPPLDEIKQSPVSQMTGTGERSSPTDKSIIEKSSATAGYAFKFRFRGHVNTPQSGSLRDREALVKSLKDQDMDDLSSWADRLTISGMGDRSSGVKISIDLEESRLPVQPKNLSSNGLDFIDYASASAGETVDIRSGSHLKETGGTLLNSGESFSQTRINDQSYFDCHPFESCDIQPLVAPLGGQNSSPWTMI